MSAEATGWVWKNSPYDGVGLLIHLAIADVVNDAHGNEFWMTVDSLAVKCRVSRSSAFAALADMVERGYLQKLAVGGGRGHAARYRFVGETVQRLDETVQSMALNRPIAGQELNRTKEQLLQAESVQNLDAFRKAKKTPPPWVQAGLSRKEWNEQQAGGNR